MSWWKKSVAPKNVAQKAPQGRSDNRTLRAEVVDRPGPSSQLPPLRPRKRATR